LIALLNFQQIQLTDFQHTLTKLQRGIDTPSLTLCPAEFPASPY